MNDTEVKIEQMTNGSLPQTKELLKAIEKMALINRRMQPEDCKHLTADEVVMTLLKIL